MVLKPKFSFLNLMQHNQIFITVRNIMKKTRMEVSMKRKVLFFFSRNQKEKVERKAEA
jgi:hypothetical protein